MKATLSAVGCIGLFGCASDSWIQHPLTTSKGSIQHAVSRAQDTTKRDGTTPKGRLNRADSRREPRESGKPRVKPKDQREQPNARHHPPRIQLNSHGVFRMEAALLAVGWMPMLDSEPL